jgi:hypothetical protein
MDLFFTWRAVIGFCRLLDLFGVFFDAIGVGAKDFHLMSLLATAARQACQQGQA